MDFGSENYREDIKEIVEKCIKCGRCKLNCPVFRVVREEQFSPRGRAILLEKNYFEKLNYDCTLCKSCEKNCPLNLKLTDAFIKARAVLISQKKELPENKEMVKNLNTTGNIFGIEVKEED